MENLTTKIWELLTIYGLKVIAAVAVYVVGRWIAKGFGRLCVRMLTKRNVDPTLVSFAGSMTHIGLLVFFILAALAQLGIQTTAFIAVIGAAGLAIGLALQGSLANFAAGFLMIVFRPFKVNDYIEGAGIGGTVEKIQIFTTQLRTPDNKTVIIPNAKLTEDNIINYTTKGTRRVDMVFGIGYGDDMDKAKKVIGGVLEKDERILKDPAPTIGVSELADSSVNFVVRPWVNGADYWNVYFNTMESIKKQFNAEGITIPFPQQDVHLYNYKE